MTPGSSTDLVCITRLDINELFCSVDPESETTLSNEDHVSGPFMNPFIRDTDHVRDVYAVTIKLESVVGHKEKYSHTNSNIWSKIRNTKALKHILSF